MKQNICIFTKCGATFSFKDVSVYMDNETLLRYSYVAMSDDLIKEATFYKSNLAGSSLTMQVVDK